MYSWGGPPDRSGIPAISCLSRTRLRRLSFMSRAPKAFLMPCPIISAMVGTWRELHRVRRASSLPVSFDWAGSWQAISASANANI